jgi:hypothetical protein
MSLQGKVSINTHYTRSVNLERDSDSLDVIRSYIPTSRALRTFSKIADTLHDRQAPRAWSLVGPYGSGKSSFSVFLSQLLSQPEEIATKEATRILENSGKELSVRFKTANRGKGGYLKVLITGAPEPLSLRLVRGFAEAAEGYWQGKRGKNPSIIKQLKEAVSNGSISTTELIDLIKALQVQLAKSNAGGILLVIDELGKFLEYEARHYGANDIYILQALAEHACQGSEVNLLLFALLHQSFEQYAKGLGESLKNEWSKVQGRFEEIPFLESAEQVLRVVSAAFNQQLTKQELGQIRKTTSEAVTVLAANDALPGSLSNKEAEQLFISCYPLHPLSAILLPHLCQKVAQNERTLFSYLGSHEEYGLADMLEKLDSVKDFVYPHHIYEYFITNQSAVVGDYLTHRRWAEVVTAIERLGDAKPEEIALLKTIGILNIIGSKGGFKASKELLALTLKTKAAFDKATRTLNQKSVVTYRRYNSEYRVWQGSDFDLELVLNEEINNIGNFSLADELNQSKSLLPVVARRYTIRNGALRFFQPYFVDAKSYKSFPIKSDEPRIIFYLSGGQDDEKLFKEKISGFYSELDLVVLCMSGSQLREAVSETQALQRVQINNQELHSDPIAKREFEDRLTAAEQAQESILQSLLDSPENDEWYFQGNRKTISSKRALQEVMSEVLESAYHLAPIIHNEIINRDSPSSQANGARNKLLYAMLNFEDKADLGIEKYPPEKAIYRSLLRATGLHKEGANGDWKFFEPDTDRRKQKKLEKISNIRPVWDRINEFLDNTEKEARSLIDLNKELIAPPYGVKAGVLPILYIAVYSVYQHELALYENRRYKPKFTQEMLERFVKRPDEFEFQRFKIEGLKESVFEQYSKVIYEDSKRRNLLELAQPLASFMGDLPEYTQKTRRGIGRLGQEVRTAFNLAKSPQKLLLEDLPKALGFESLQERGSEKELLAFAQTLTETLRELRDAYSNMLDMQKTYLSEAFKIDTSLELSELRVVITGKCHGLQESTIDTQGLKAFIMRLTDQQGKDEEWFDKVLMFLGHKSTKKWSDSDQDIAEHRLKDFSQRVIDLKQLSIYSQKKGGKADSKFDVYLLRSIKVGCDFMDEVVAIDKQTAKNIKSTKEDLGNVLKELDDKELKLAVLAELVDEFLAEYKKEQSTTPKVEDKEKAISLKSVSANASEK